MKVQTLGKIIKNLGIRTITGIPDSTLQEFCVFLDSAGKEMFDNYIVPANEGAAVGIAIGEYLSTGVPACVYMQNSGLGNAVNPITSLANDKVYGIPMLFLIGWRGEPGRQDEPQHKFMGEITSELVELLNISYDIIEAETSEEDLENIRQKIAVAFSEKKQYALVIKRGTFESDYKTTYQNQNVLVREDAIKTITDWLQPEDIVISTTGKISRELYENMDDLKGSHEQAFLCVGGMGHANMIAYQMAKRKPDKRVVCLDGDGALLMHMGSLAIIGCRPVDNLVHICLDNEAHESVGGMYTGAGGTKYGEIAKICGYQNVFCVKTDEELKNVLMRTDVSNGLCFIIIKVAISSRADLIRPKESAEENKIRFMEYHGEKM